MVEFISEGEEVIDSIVQLLPPQSRSLHLHPPYRKHVLYSRTEYCANRKELLSHGLLKSVF